MGKYLFHAAIMMCCLWIIGLKTIIIFHLEAADVLERLQYLDWAFAWVLLIIWLYYRHVEKLNRTKDGAFIIELENDVPSNVRKIDPEEIVDRAMIRYKMYTQLIQDDPVSYRMRICYKKADEFLKEELPIFEVKDRLDAAVRVLQMNGESLKLFHNLQELLEWSNKKKFHDSPAIQKYLSQIVCKNFNVS